MPNCCYTIITNRPSAKNGGLASKLIGAGKKVLRAGVLAGAVAGASLMPYAGSNEAKADMIEIANQVDDDDFTYYPGAIKPDGTPGATIGYDGDEIDRLLSTAGNPNPWASVVYSDLGGNIADINVAPQPTLTDSYTMKLSFEDNGSNKFGISNYLTLTDFVTDTASDYNFTLFVDTGNEIYTNSGLVSNVFASIDKKFGQWSQDFLASGSNPNWNAKSYGQITFTPTNVPEPTTLALLAGAGLAGAGYVASQLRKGKKKRNSRSRI